MKPLRSLLLFAAAIMLAACSNTYHKADKGFFDVKTTPPLHLLEIINPNLMDPTDKDAPDKLEFAMNDQTVYKFTYLIEDTMRKRAVHGRKWEEGLSGLQVVFAAFAAAFSASTGVDPDVVTTLAGLSALLPDLAQIFNAGDKAKAYSQALELVENANSTYIKERAQSAKAPGELIPSTELTNEGAALFVSVTSSLKILRGALLQTLPSEEDLAKASGKYSLFSVSARALDISVDTTQTSLVTTAAGVPFSLQDPGKQYYTRQVALLKGEGIDQCVPENPAIATTENCSGKSFTIVPQMEGSTPITVIGKDGNKAVITLTVTAKVAAAAPAAGS